MAASEKKSIDYFGLMKESFEFTWKHKILWIFGFIVAFFSGGSGGNSGSSGNIGDTGSSSDSLTRGAEEVGNKVNDIVTSPTFWIIVAIVVLVLLVLMVVGWYLRTVASTALIKAAQYGEQGKENEIVFKSLWKKAHPYLLKLLLYGLLWFVLYLPVIAVGVGIIFLFALAGPFGAVAGCCLLIPVVTVLFVAMAAVASVGGKFLVLKDLGVWESVMYAWDFLKKNLGQSILAFLVMILPGLAFGLINLILAFAVVLPFVLGVIAVVLMEQYVLAIVFGILGVLLIGALMAGLKAPYVVFTETYWVKFLTRMDEE